MRLFIKLWVFICVAGLFLAVEGCKQKKNEQSIEGKLFDSHGAEVEFAWPKPIANRTEFSSRLLENFPERVDHKQGWLDGKFVAIDNTPIESLMGSSYTSISVAFAMEDKDGDIFQFCLADKNKLGDTLLGLKRGDRIRVTGQAVSMATSKMWISVDSVEILK